MSCSSCTSCLSIFPRDEEDSDEDDHAADHRDCAEAFGGEGDGKEGAEDGLEAVDDSSGGRRDEGLVAVHEILANHRADQGEEGKADHEFLVVSDGGEDGDAVELCAAEGEADEEADEAGDQEHDEGEARGVGHLAEMIDGEDLGPGRGEERASGAGSAARLARRHRDDSDRLHPRR